MRSNLPGLFGAMALATAGMPQAPGGTLLWIPLCHGSAIPIELPGDGDRQPGKTCPGGCHAACLTRKDMPDDEADDA